MPKPKRNLNTIYISERLQESLRPISRYALTAIIAPMGYGKTTAVNWYLEQRAKVCELFASAYILITLRFSGKAHRTPLPAPVMTFCGTISAPQTHPAADCWWMISAMSWRERPPAISSWTIFIS